MTGSGEASPLRELADRYGIVPEYRDQTGRETRVTTDETRATLLKVMGIDASSDAAIRRALDDAREAERRDLVAPVVVAQRRDAKRVVVAIPEGHRGDVRWSLELREEGGAVHRANGTARQGKDGRVRVRLPHVPEPGYHEVTLEVTTSGGTHDATQSLIVVPPACPSPVEVLKRRKVFGITANLYTVRSARNWGIGDLGDLATLARWGGSVGAQFVGVNPLHALRNTGGDVSPYSPVSRLFRNVIYLDVEAIPELAASEEARRLIASPETQAALREVRASGTVEYDRVMALKMPVLRALYRAFAGGASPESPSATAHHPPPTARRYFESQGEPLLHFATFLALEEHLARDGTRGGSWREWPREYRDPKSPAVRRFREQQREAIDFHRWLQFVVDSQLEAAAKTARDAGMTIGLYQDLAIGTSPDGSDTWAMPELFVRDTSIGAPPDPYSATGQDWGLPPMNPLALKRERYAYWIRLVRSSLRHAGALRIDHVMGLFRQFWIPAGKTGKEGAYVRFPSEDLLGILALETTRAGALVVGEDLGTVPEDVPPAMKRWNVLSSRVLYFEREDETGFKPAASYDAMALATANTHDMPTLEGFWCGRDVDVRREVGLIESDEEADKARQDREKEKEALLQRLRDDGVLKPGEAPSGAALRGAVHDFLCRTPSALVGLSLDDIVGEAEPVNVPGVGTDRFASWTRRLSLPLESLATDEQVGATLRCNRTSRA